MIPRLAVVATHNRPAELARLLDAVAPQCHAVFIVDNASDPPVRQPEPEEWPLGLPDPITGDPMRCWVKVTHDEEQPPNLSRLWNVGLQMAADYVRGGDIDVYDVAVLNDDAVPPPGWFHAVASAMRMTTAMAACADPWDTLPAGAVKLWGSDAPMSVHTRLAGWAMVLRGEWEGARFDERYRWWAGDDDMSLRARKAGGVLHVGGYPVDNTGANTSTVGVLAEQSGRDMAAFVQKWGMRPW